MCTIEKMLFFDPQQAREKICPGCRRAIYAPGYHCPRCEEATL